MKKILLLIVLVLVVVFVGKYVYDKQASEGSVSLGDANSANVSVSKDQLLTVERGKTGDVLRYVGTMKVVNSSKQASSSFTFLNMPVLYKLIPGTTQYAIATSAIPTGSIKDDRGQIYPLTGPIFVIGVGALKQFTVDARWVGLPSGTYKAALGTSNNWSGYSINGGALQPLPTMQTNAVNATATPKVYDLEFTHSSSSLKLVKNSANGSITGLEAQFNEIVGAIGKDVLASSLRGSIQVVNATSGQVVASSSVQGIGPSGQIYYAEGGRYAVQFMSFVPIANLRPATVYKAQFIGASWNFADMTWKNKAFGTSSPTTNTISY